MAVRSFQYGLLFLALMGPLDLYAFRTCATENSHAYSAATRYVVGEIALDAGSGLATGTETTYNHFNQGEDGHTECHVTYELSGIFESTSGTLVLDAHRTNHSNSCPDDLIFLQYPGERLYALQIEFIADGSTRVNSADSGEVLAHGDWTNDSTAYRTRETCEIF